MGTINLTWWNLQNFFDTDDDPISEDFEYTQANGWTPEVFQAKKQNLADALNATHAGAGPELLVVCEIEKDTLLEQLIAAMGNTHLKVVKDLSGTRDLRGIDVTMAYDDRKLEINKVTVNGQQVDEVRSHLVHLRYRTRDLFEVGFRVKETGEKLVVIAGHWPSRRLGKYRTEPIRIAVAEHVSYLVEAHVKFAPEEYERLRSQNDLESVRRRWDTKVLVVGDLNDEPGDRSVVDHLRASNDLDRVIGETNDIDDFKDKTGDYRAQEAFLFNAMYKFLPEPNAGTYFIDRVQGNELVTNRYQVLDQLVASRGLVSGNGLTLDRDSVSIFRDPIVATGSGRPRKFEKESRKGSSDHLPVTAVLRY